MQLNNEQLDRIVSEVVRRLSATTSGNPTAAAPSANSCQELAIDDRVVTVQSLPDQLDGVAVLRVCESAIVTPAARDLLADRCISLVRGESESPTRPQPPTMSAGVGRGDCDQCWRY